MWWQDAGFEKVLTDKSGERWNFKVWHGYHEGQYLQRIFFWTDSKSQTGLIEFNTHQTLHRTKLKDRIIKLVNNEEYRNKFLKELEFPVEEKYYNYSPIS
ncbi:hypothetical protein H7F15_14510 [Pontibacter sp. Tf4]|uniref:hypothetical protein n=1 Tax=Pontibacter sp. Tf4 TaxID=2761620 RepID=UPI00162ABA7C|nr:hypothetical protein [Pontibacter sp. Tf4]MBB6612259.1 hypothetical protein [Pontibacter sp. Tf4]